VIDDSNKIAKLAQFHKVVAVARQARAEDGVRIFAHIVHRPMMILTGNYLLYSLQVFSASSKP